MRRTGRRHLAAGLGFLVAGGALVAWRSGPLAAGTFPDAGVLAAAHLLTLGWISTSLMAGLYWFLPAVLGAPLRWPRLGDVTLVGWGGGIVAFAAGLTTGVAALPTLGAAVLGLSALLFAGHVAASLRHAPRRGLAWWCIAGAAVSLLAAWVLGFLLTVNLFTGLLGGSRGSVLLVHVHLAAGGWILLALVGLAHRLLPALRTPRGTGERSGDTDDSRIERARTRLRPHGGPLSDVPGVTAAVLTGAGTAALLLSEHLLPVGVIRPGLGLLAGGAGAFLLQVGLHFPHRRGRGTPASVLVAGGLLCLAAAVAAGVTALASPAPGARLLTVYGVLLIPGGLGLLAVGGSYGLAPVLAATGDSEDGVSGERRDPRPDPPDCRLALAGAGALVAGVLAGAAGVLVGSASVVRAGGLAYTGGALVAFVQLAPVVLGDS